jgi:hypothetical protein
VHIGPIEERVTLGQHDHVAAGIEMYGEPLGRVRVELVDRALIAAWMVGGLDGDGVDQWLLDLAGAQIRFGDRPRVAAPVPSRMKGDDVRCGDQPRGLHGDQLGVAGTEPDAEEAPAHATGPSSPDRGRRFALLGAAACAAASFASSFASDAAVSDGAAAVSGGAAAPPGPAVGAAEGGSARCGALKVGRAAATGGLRPAGAGVFGVAVAKTAGGEEKAAGDGDACAEVANFAGGDEKVVEEGEEKAAGVDAPGVAAGDVGGGAEKAAGGGEATAEADGEDCGVARSDWVEEEKAAAGGREPGLDVEAASDGESGDVVDGAFGMKAGAAAAG